MIGRFKIDLAVLFWEIPVYEDTINLVAENTSELKQLKRDWKVDTF